MNEMKPIYYSTQCSVNACLPNVYQCAFLAGFCNGSNNDNGETQPRALPGRDTSLASPLEADEKTAAAAASTASADTSATSEDKSSSESSEQNNERERDIFRDLSDNEDTEDTSLQCDHCSDKFMSETSMRIHAVRCNRSRQQSEQPDTGKPIREEIRR